MGWINNPLRNSGSDKNERANECVGVMKNHGITYCDANGNPATPNGIGYFPASGATRPFCEGEFAKQSHLKVCPKPAPTYVSPPLPKGCSEFRKLDCEKDSKTKFAESAVAAWKLCPAKVTTNPVLLNGKPINWNQDEIKIIENLLPTGKIEETYPDSFFDTLCHQLIAIGIDAYSKGEL